MKYYKGIFAFILVWFSHFSMAIPITNLITSDANIFVGEQFSLEVRIDNDITNEELLSFGFDIAPIAPQLSYTGYAIGSDFFDLSVSPMSIQGASFPGVASSDVLLATLFFDALDVGTIDINIQGIYDGIFSGLYYVNSGVDIIASSSIVIRPQVQSANEPYVNTMILIGIFLLLWQALLVNKSNLS